MNTQGQGIAQADAARAYDSGCWDEVAIRYLHIETSARGWKCSYLPDWGFVVGGNRIVYNTMTRTEIDDALSLTGPWLVPPTCYTDGSGMTAAKPAGIGVAIFRGTERPLLISEGIGPGTNYSAELMAIWRALRAFPQLAQNMTIHSDSEYAIGAVTQDWQRNKNVGLIAAIREDLELRQAAGAVISISHVDGHKGHAGNEIADALAGVGRKYGAVTRYGEPQVADPVFSPARVG